MAKRKNKQWIRKDLRLQEAKPADTKKADTKPADK